MATSKFDPLQYGATPVSDFNPSAYGATPIADTPTRPLSQSLWASLASGAGNIIKGIEQPFVSLAAAPVQGLAKAFGRPDPYANKALGGIDVTPLGLKQKAGDALKAGSEIAAVATAPASLPAALGIGGAIGAAQGAGTALQRDAGLSEIATQGAIGGTVGAVTGGALFGIGRIIGAAGDKIQTSIIKPSKADMADGFSLDTIKKYNLGGSLNTTLQKTQTKLNELSTQLSTKLQSADTSIDMQSVFNETVKELTDASKLKGFGANKKIATTLEQLREEVNLVGNTLSIPDAQVVKQASGNFGAWQFGKVDPDSKASEIVFNTFYNKLKKAIEVNSPEGVRSINQELSKLIPIMNAAIRRLPVAERSNLISLNEMIGLIGTSINPVALGPTLLAILSRSGAAGTLLGKIGPGISRTAAPTSLITGAGAAQVSTPMRAPQQ